MTLALNNNYDLNTIEGQQEFLNEKGGDLIGQRGLVAFAGRTALRVLPILGANGEFNYWKKDILEEYLRAIDRCIYWAFIYASHDSKLTNILDPNLVKLMARTAGTAGTEANFANESNYAYIARAAANAANATHSAYFSRASVCAAYAANTAYAARASKIPSLEEYNGVIESQKDDLLWLIEYGVGSKFFQRDLLLDGQNVTEDWKRIEASFQSELKIIGLSEIWENYSSKGLEYLSNLKSKHYETLRNQTEVYTINRENTVPVLDVNLHAQVVSEVLERFNAEKGQFVGLFGRWGRGKTFFWEKLWNQYESRDQNPFIKVEFHAWKYQDTPASWAYLYEKLSSNFLGKPWQIFKYWPKLFILNLYRGAWKGPLLGFAIAMFLIIIRVIFRDKITRIWDDTFGLLWSQLVIIVGSLSFIIVGIVQKVKKEFSTRARDIFERISKKVSFEGHLGAQAEIQNEIKKLLKVWCWKGELYYWLVDRWGHIVLNNTENSSSKKNKTFISKLVVKALSILSRNKKRLLIFIDDIDRCDEDKLIAIVDSVRVMLEDDEIKRHIVVLAAVDERILKLAIANKYRKITQNADKSLLVNLTREYMDKLFIAGIKLNQLDDNKLEEVMSSITRFKGKNSLISPEIANFKGNDEFHDFNDKSYKPEKKNSGKIETKKKLKDIDIKNDKPNKKDKTQKITDNNYLLSHEEYQVLLQYIPFFEEATPRTMHIYLYRYALGLRLLQIHGAALVKDNIKHSKSHYTLLARLIVLYSSRLNADDIVNDVTKLRLAEDKKDIVEITLLDEKINASKKTLLEVYEVLEMVVGY